MDLHGWTLYTCIWLYGTITTYCYNIPIFGRQSDILGFINNNFVNQRLLYRMCLAYSKWSDCSIVRNIETPVILARHYRPDVMNRLLSLSRIVPDEAHTKRTENTIYPSQPSWFETAKIDQELNFKLSGQHLRPKKRAPVVGKLVRQTLTNTHINGDVEMTTVKPVAPVTNVSAIMTTIAVSTPITNISTTRQTSTIPENVGSSNVDKFMEALDRLERKFYLTTYSRLLAISPPDRQENGMSFVQSGLFLQLVLMALSTEVDTDTMNEIDTALGLSMSESDKINVIREVISLLPIPSDDLKFRWSSRLVLCPTCNVSQEFVAGAASALQLHIDTFSASDSPENRAQILNEMVERDSGGAIRNTFEEDEVPVEACAVQLSTLYLRALWRAAPTALNGTRPFLDAPAAPRRVSSMIRINDLMRHAHLPEWDAQAIELMYSTSGLSLVLVVPRGRSLRRLAHLAAGIGLHHICARMQTLRVAATMPLYTLRMTLLLPNKLDAMGITRLANVTTSDKESLRLSHAIQRIMFWAEAGRNAFKDDGIEWDEPPELELVIDRPYVFFVRWRNMTLMNGNFVL